MTNNLLLFDLSDNSNPITYNGLIMGNVADIVEQVEIVSPDLADMIKHVLDTQQKQIEDLTQQLEDLQTSFNGLQSTYDSLQSNIIALNEVELSELCSEIEYQADIEKHIRVKTKEKLLEKVNDIVEQIHYITGTI